MWKGDTTSCISFISVCFVARHISLDYILKNIPCPILSLVKTVIVCRSWPSGNAVFNTNKKLRKKGINLAILLCSVKYKCKGLLFCLGESHATAYPGNYFCWIFSVWNTYPTKVHLLSTNIQCQASYLPCCIPIFSAKYLLFTLQECPNMPCAVWMWQKSSALLNKYYRVTEKPVEYILQQRVRRVDRRVKVTNRSFLH